ncbi:lysylphosphatidylglycerol synthase transmembrane domain-containing protein [Luteimonas abyssi]|uniref:lysylphosphatidylglycerol synthase transmembrane domain-containing protein n=1 Tax=Luteimonas abyssi TaxID=1247514 RepID=UPI000737AD1D|nr:lysylphosphatidylglycerol synthase domain-containing protein [Luteimonas abyssi]
MRAHLIGIAKWAWIGLVVLAAALVVQRSWNEMAQTLLGLSPWMVGASVILTMAAKLCLAENARLAAKRLGFRLGYVEAATLYNLSQLGKYLPGSIWQFVGRAAAYRHRGAEYAQIRDILLIESLWVVVGAAAIGALLTGSLLPLMAEALGRGVTRWLVGFGAACLASIAALFVWKRHLFDRYARLAWPDMRVLLVQLVTWALLGIAFWVLARACGLDTGLAFATGLYAAAYAIGFMVPFAPAGLGVRDAILTVALLPFASTGEALTITVLSRLVYLAVDLLMVVGQEALSPLLRDRGGTGSTG